MIKRNRVNENSPLFFARIAEEKWLSSGDVAKFLSVTPNAVRIMVCRGILPAYKMRGRLRFRRSDCVTLFEKKGA